MTVGNELRLFVYLRRQRMLTAPDSKDSPSELQSPATTETREIRPRGDQTVARFEYSIPRSRQASHAKAEYSSKSNQV